MRDGPIRRIVKGIVLGIWTLELRLRRGLRRLRGGPRHRLAGACEGCARCCEEPSIQVDRLTWYLPTVRWAFLTWQRVLNGFVLVRADRETRTFGFSCTHFDRTTRRCDSYSSRPGLCRDYPRALLDQAWPQLFPECGFRPVLRDGSGMSQALERTDLGPEQLTELRRRLHLDDEDPD